ncbi:MAG: carbon-nitrogen hydrolase family protein [Pirellulales bacterium]|nr:carbon-nitrogen hydrolase family protein [Pirellulales bacterium]
MHARFAPVMLILLTCVLLLGGHGFAPAAEPPTAESGAIRTAGLIFQPAKWDKDENTRRLDIAIRKAQKDGAQLVVTPEGALEGYVVNEVIRATGEKRQELTDRFNTLAEPIDGPHIRHFQELCKELNIHLVLGFLEADEGKTYNTAVVIGPEGKIIGKYRKTHFAQGYSHGDKKGDNPPSYTRGTEYPVFDVGSAKMGVMICFDRRVPKVARRLVENGAQIIVNPSYGMSGDKNRRYISDRAKETGVPVLFVHPKQAVFATADGQIAADVRPKKGQETTCMVSIRPISEIKKSKDEKKD